MNYEAYEALENKMDKLYSEIIDKSATIEKEEDLENISDWLDNEYDEISFLMWNFATNSFTVVHLPVQSVIDLQTGMFKVEPGSFKKPETRIMIDAEKLLEMVDKEKLNYFSLTNYLNAYIDGQKGKLQ